jgi:hypothetical protein
MEGNSLLQVWKKWMRMDRTSLRTMHVKALSNMLKNNWAILGYNKVMVCSKHNTIGERCNYMFNNLFFGIWCVTGFEDYSMHLYLIYDLYQLWG